MKKRILSGAMLVAICAAVVAFNRPFPMILNIVTALVSALSIHELINALGLQKKWFLYVPALLAALLVPLCPAKFRFEIYCIFTAVLFAAMLRYHQETTYKEVAVLYSMVLLIPSALQTLVLVRDLYPVYGMFYVSAAVFSAWIADAGGYFAGTFFGRHKLCPEISPKKTVEGVAGGLVLDVAVLMLAGFAASRLFYSGQAVSVNYFALFLAGFLGTPISILGDLSFSLIKRCCHIKDFGQAIPGHGGILDRFDSVIFTAPFIYLLADVLPFFG